MVLEVKNNTIPVRAPRKKRSKNPKDKENAVPTENIQPSQSIKKKPVKKKRVERNENVVQTTEPEPVQRGIPIEFDTTIHSVVPFEQLKTEDIEFLKKDISFDFFPNSIEDESFCDHIDAIANMFSILYNDIPRYKGELPQENYEIRNDLDEAIKALKTFSYGKHPTYIRFVKTFIVCHICGIDLKLSDWMFFGKTDASTGDFIMKDLFLRENFTSIKTERTQRAPTHGLELSSVVLKGDKEFELLAHTIEYFLMESVKELIESYHNLVVVPMTIFNDFEIQNIIQLKKVLELKLSRLNQ